MKKQIIILNLITHEIKTLVFQRRDQQKENVIYGQNFQNVNKLVISLPGLG